MFILQILLLYVTVSIKDKNASKLELTTYTKFIFDIFTLAILNFVFSLPITLNPEITVSTIQFVIVSLVVAYIYFLKNFAELSVLAEDSVDTTTVETGEPIMSGI